MDPNENIKRQRELAQGIIADTDRITDDGGNTPDEFWQDGTVEAIWQRGEELAALVLALDEWRRTGGFDPYEQTGVAS